MYWFFIKIRYAHHAEYTFTTHITKKWSKIGAPTAGIFYNFFAMGDSVDKRYIQFENTNLSQLENAYFYNLPLKS